MDVSKALLARILIDVLLLLCAGICILGFYLWGKPFERGFFCDDESLKHPFKESTVKSWMLYLIGIGIPGTVIFLVEIIKCLKKPTNENIGQQYEFLGYDVPEWVVQCYRKIGIFAFGAIVSQLITDIAKYSIGRLRPHFITVCQPILANNSTCEDPQNIGIYIQNFTCKGDNSTKRMLKEMRLSFPSGHSSFAFYTMLYLAIYLQVRLDWRRSKLLRHFLQFGLLLIAFYTALSRVSDYKHHWSDVLAGSIIGSLSAILVAKYVSDLNSTDERKDRKTMQM